MPTFQDKASRLLKQQKANKPKLGHGLPPSNDGFEGENRIQIVEIVIIKRIVIIIMKK